jgi:hypothetical protein
MRKAIQKNSRSLSLSICGPVLQASRATCLIWTGMHRGLQLRLGENYDANQIGKLRLELEKEYVFNYFQEPADIAREVSVAVHLQLQVIDSVLQSVIEVFEGETGISCNLNTSSCSQRHQYGISGP